MKVTPLRLALLALSLLAIGPLRTLLVRGLVALTHTYARSEIAS